jgi:hypothetical protein
LKPTSGQRGERRVDLEVATQLAGIPPYANVAATSWRVPIGVHLDGDRLVWPEHRWVERAGEDCDERFLLRFANLADAKDEEILQFARKWGVLELCAHGLPATHQPLRLPMTRWKPPAPCEGQRRVHGGVELCAEPLDSWRYFAGQASALLLLLSDLRRGDGQAPDLGPVLFDLVPPRLRPQGSPSSARGREVTGSLPRYGRIGPITVRLPPAGFAALCVRRWLQLGDVQVVYSWRQEGPSLEYGSHTLFGALALQLAATTTTGDIYMCSGHGGLYKRTGRRPPRGGRNYCPDCRAARTKDRDHMRRRRAREMKRGKT